ncbi:MAG: helix-turn-helix transcriptional regulator [Ruminococcaceae bacterium]|nr:helix-turn-helix transcriptional regulator [Oscillospiraceae bacterium]
MSTISPTTIGERIKFYREKFGLTQEDVAIHLSTTPQNIYKYEKGIIENIPLSNIVAMAELFKVAPSELAGWSNSFSRAEPTASDDAKRTSTAQNPNEIELTEFEIELILKYRENVQLQSKINSLLEINPDEFRFSNPVIYQKFSVDLHSSRGLLKVASPTASHFPSKKNGLNFD